jgi:hypothetical protein
MAWLALPLLIAVAFGGMALACAWSERAEERRILARAEAILARGSIAADIPAPAAGAHATDAGAQASDADVAPAGAGEPVEAAEPPEVPVAAPGARVRSVA